jgi:diamine N-acetyltransferase
VYTSNRIRLRAPERTDIPRFVEWLNNPEVTRGLVMVYPMSMEEEVKWFDRMLQQPPELHPWVIEVQTESGWQAIGNCGFHDVDWRNSNAEFGIFIGDPAYWGKGYGQEAIRILLQVGFDTMNLHRIWLRVMSNNTRAIKCYDALGFVHEGVKREAEYREGKYLDMLLMSMLREEWKKISTQ